MDTLAHRGKVTKLTLSRGLNKEHVLFIWGPYALGSKHDDMSCRSLTSPRAVRHCQATWGINRDKHRLSRNDNEHPEL